jgi:hypothetical protein
VRGASCRGANLRRRVFHRFHAPARFVGATRSCIAYVRQLPLDFEPRRDGSVPFTSHPRKPTASYWHPRALWGGTRRGTWFRHPRRFEKPPTPGPRRCLGPVFADFIRPVGRLCQIKNGDNGASLRHVLHDADFCFDGASSIVTTVVRPPPIATTAFLKVRSLRRTRAAQAPPECLLVRVGAAANRGAQRRGRVAFTNATTAHLAAAATTATSRSTIYCCTGDAPAAAGGGGVAARGGVGGRHVPAANRAAQNPVTHNMCR